MVIAHNSHDTKRLHSILTRVELRAAPLVAEDDVWVEVRVQVFNANLHRLDLAFKRRLALSGRVIGALAARPVGSVAVNVHVGVLAAIAAAVDEDGSLNVAAVGEGGGTAEATDAATVTAAREYFILRTGYKDRDTRRQLNTDEHKTDGYLDKTPGSRYGFIASSKVD